MILAALAIACLPAVQDEAVELRWTYVKGEVLRYRMSQRVSSDANGTPVRQQMTTTMAFEVLEVDPKGVATLRTVYEAVAAHASGLQEYDYDSEKDKEPPDDPAARILAKLVGQSFTMKMGPDGKVVDVRGTDVLVEAMVRGVAEDEASREKLRQAMGQTFSDEAFRSRMQQMATVLPESKVRKGEAWSNEFSLRLPMIHRVTYKMRSRLAEVKDGTASIEQDITVEFAGKDDRDHELSGQVEAKEAKGKSTCRFALSPGRFLSQKAQVDMVLVIGKSTVPVRVETELTLLGKK